MSEDQLLFTPLKLPCIQAGGGKQENKKKVLQSSPSSLHLETPLSILIQSFCVVSLNLLSLVQVYYFTKYCGQQLLLSCKLRKYGYFKALGSPSHLGPRRSPQTHSTKFLYMYRVQKQMHGIPFRLYSSLFTCVRDFSELSFLFGVWQSLLVKTLSFKYKAKLPSYLQP